MCADSGGWKYLSIGNDYSGIVERTVADAKWFGAFRVLTCGETRALHTDNTFASRCEQTVKTQGKTLAGSDHKAPENNGNTERNLMVGPTTTNTLKATFPYWPRSVNNQLGTYLSLYGT